MKGTIENVKDSHSKLKLFARLKRCIHLFFLMAFISVQSIEDAS